MINERGLLEETRLNRGETLAQIRRKLQAAPDNDDWVIWGRWFLADPATRTISTFSKLTVPEYIENRIREQTAQALDEAARLAKGNSALALRISKGRAELASSKKSD